MLSKEELLKGRVKVINPYPNSPYEVGEILTEFFFENGNSYFSVNKNEKSFPDRVIKSAILKECPNIFKEMSWWEEREESDMPKYLKYYEGEDLQFVLRGEKYKSHRDMKLFWSFEYLWENEPDIKRMSLTGWLPATKEEYEQYQQSKLK